MPDNSDSAQYEFMRPLVTGWLSKINLGIRHRKRFMDVAEQCMGFYSGVMGFMWEDKFRHKFLGGKCSPKFKLSIAKAFELVALFGPVLYNRNPTRSVRPFEKLQYGPEIFGDPNDPNVQQQFQMFAQADAQEAAMAKMRAKLMELYLNYTPREQPAGGLRRHAEDAITEALIKGRGCLWIEPYRTPGSNRMLTGCFHSSVDDLVIDPDAETLAEAKWIARRRVAPTWEVERRFGLESGTLRERGNSESNEAIAERRSNELGDIMRKRGETFDLITFWEIWSKGGVGGRLSGVTSGLSKDFDEVVGDFAYIVVAENVSFPLNATTKMVAKATDDEVKKAFDWPIPFYADDRWPVILLDFYRQPNHVWPIAPLAPALGELTALNIIMSHLVNRVWSSSRDFIAVLESAAIDIEQKLQDGEDLCVIRLKDIHNDINKVVSFLKQPEVRFDVWRIVEALFELFDKRTGLTELLYSLNPGGVQSRSATDMNVKNEKASIRPDYMAEQVETWMSEAARMEKLAAYWTGIRGEDLRPLLGNAGSMLWDRFIAEAPPELVISEMDATVEAGSARKPNKQRDQENIQQMLPALLPIADNHANATTDTGPLNALIAKWGEAIEEDMGGIQFGPRTPPPPPPEIQQQQQQQMEMQMQAEQAKQQAEQAKQQAGLAAAQMKLQGLQMKTQADAAKMAMDQAAFAAEMRQDAQEHAQEMIQDQEVHEQEMRQDAEEARSKLRAAQAMDRLKRIQVGKTPQSKAPAGGGSRT